MVGVGCCSGRFCVEMLDVGCSWEEDVGLESAEFGLMVESAVELEVGFGVCELVGLVVGVGEVVGPFEGEGDGEGSGLVDGNGVGSDVAEGGVGVGVGVGAIGTSGSGASRMGT